MVDEEMWAEKDWLSMQLRAVPWLKLQLSQRHSGSTLVDWAPTMMICEGCDDHAYAPMPCKLNTALAILNLFAKLHNNDECRAGWERKQRKKLLGDV